MGFFEFVYDSEWFVNGGRLYFWVFVKRENKVRKKKWVNMKNINKRVEMYKWYVDFVLCVIWNGKGGFCLFFKDFLIDFGEIFFNL